MNCFYLFCFVLDWYSFCSQNRPVLDPSKNTIPWLTKEGELSKKRVEKEIERLSKPTVQYQMFPSTLELYERLAKIDSFRFTV